MMMDNLKKNLQNPPKKYRAIPFWSWNEKLDVEETAWQIAEMDKAGIGGYFMHARGGLQTEYMGEEWMDNVRCGIEEGEKRGMSAWGYDENGWPSGFGSGVVNGLGLKYQQKYLRYELVDTPQNKEHTICNLPYDGKLVHLYFDVNPFYVDTLDAEVLAVFLEKIHDRYVAELGDDFSKMDGFFTDEPQVSRNGIPWSFILPDAYQAAYGEELIPQLACLFFELPGYQKLRSNFWKLVRDLFTDAFMKQIYEWCEAHGTQLTGHMVLEENMISQITSNGACMPSYEYMHIPGMDWLGRDVGWSTTPVQVASVAHQTGKKQVISETFALCGWDVSFEELKWLYEWQMVRGINLLCPHLEGYTLRGIRKRDYPATLYYQQPWWPEYRSLMDTFSRIGMLLTEGEVRFDTLILHPMSSSWVCFNCRDNGILGELDWKFANFLHKLEENQIPYDIGDERIMERHGVVKGDTLAVGEQTYRAVVVPNMCNICAKTVELLEEYQANGGLLIFGGMVPELVDGVPSDRVKQLAARSRLCADADAAAALVPDAYRPVKLTPTAGTLAGVASTVRYYDDMGKALVYIVNTAQEARSFTASFAGNAIEEINYNDGSIAPAVFTAENGTVKMDITLPAMGSILLFVSEQAVAPAAEKSALAPLNDKLGKEWEIKTCDPNGLTLDYCDCWFDGELFRKNCPVNNIQEEACKFGRAVRVDMEFRFTALEKPEGPLYLVLETPEKFTVTLNGKAISTEACGFYRDKSFKKLEVTDAVTTGENVIRLSIDFVQSDEVYENIKKSLRFESEKNKLSYDTEIEAIYLIGDFAVETAGDFELLPRRGVRYTGDFAIKHQPKAVRTGNLVDQGFPFFAGRIVLKNTVTLTAEEAANRSLCFAERGATVLKVRANGQDAGEIRWQPYEADLSGLLHAGENELEIELVGNLRNLLGPHHLGEGEVYWVGPGSFFEYSDIWVGGKHPDWNDGYTFVTGGLYLK